MAQIILPIHGGAPTSSSPGMAFDTSGVPYLAYDSITDEYRIYSFNIPENYASALVVKVSYSMASATTGNVALRVKARSISDNSVIKDASFGSQETSADNAVPGTAGIKKTITLTLVTSFSAGQSIAVEIGRENTTSGTNATGDMHIWDISITYTAA